MIEVEDIWFDRDEVGLKEAQGSSLQVYAGVLSCFCQHAESDLILFLQWSN